MSVTVLSLCEKLAALTWLQCGPKMSACDAELTVMLGRTIAHYTIVDRLGSGGMGVVYKAEDTKLKRFVALKFLPADLVRDPLALQRFEREAQAASALNHPNICTIYSIDEHEAEPFIVMEFLEGQMLRDVIAGQKLGVDRIVDLGMQMTDALEAAHSKGIIHRDIKPANIFITQRGQVKILDFGLAKISARPSETDALTGLPTVGLSTNPSATMGTLTYMSPEQARGEDLDARADLFSLGAVLYEMCTGRPAFAGGTNAIIFDAILNRDPISVLRLNPEMLPRMAEILAKALEKDRDVRYQHAADLRTDLRRLRRDSDSATRVPLATAASGPKTRAQRKEAGVIRIAVLPFENVGGNPETEFLSDGVTESLISALSQVPNLRVISRTTVFRFKGLPIDPQAVGRELNVNAVLAGRMVPRGDSISINLELVDARDSSFMWGARYNRKLADLIEIEEEIAQSVAEKLPLKLSGGEKKHIARRPATNPEAYQLYLRGRYYWNRRTEQALKKGLEFFNAAIEKDPTYALAYAGIADSHAMMVWNMMVSSRDGLPNARAAAQKALEFDKKLVEAHSTLAFVKLFYEWDWKGAEQEFQRTLDLNPNYAIARQWYAMELAALGRHDEAVRETERALQLDPLSMSINTTSGLLFYLVRQFDQALEQCLKTIDLDPNFFASHFVCGLCYEEKGMHKEAVVEFKKAVELSGRWPLFLAGLGHGWATLGDRVEAEKLITELRYTSHKRYRASYSIAAIYAGLGEISTALEWMEKACDERGTWLIFLKVHPYFDSFRSQPRFIALLEQLNLNSPSLGAAG